MSTGPATRPSQSGGGELHAQHRRFLLLEQGVGSALLNFVLNGVIAWVVFGSLERVPLWGEQSIAGDTIGTAFLLPFFTCLIVTRLARGQLRSGKLPPLAWSRAAHPALGLLPRGTFARALVLGVICVAVAAPPSLWLLGHLGVDDMSSSGFIAFKAGFAALLAAIVTPLIALCALGDGGDGSAA